MSADPGHSGVEFKVTTYWKRRRNQTGLTSMASRRMTLGEALNWVLDELPEGACAITHDGSKATLVIDWDQVPDEIREGKKAS